MRFSLMIDVAMNKENKITYVVSGKRENVEFLHEVWGFPKKTMNEAFESFEEELKKSIEEINKSGRRKK